MISMVSKRMYLRKEPLTMKTTALCIVALLLGFVPAESQTARGQPAVAAINTFQSSTKLTLKKPPEAEKQPAKDVTIRVMIPASAHAQGRAEMVKAKRAFYYDGRRASAVLAAKDPRHGQPFLSLAVYEGIYVLRTSGVTAFSIQLGGQLVWRESYIETAESGKLQGAVNRLESAFNGELLNETILKLRDAHRVNLAPAGPRYFFEGPGLHGPVFIPLIEMAEMTNNTLRLGIRNPVTQEVAEFWIDVEARKVVKCVAAFKELGVSIDRGL